MWEEAYEVDDMEAFDIVDESIRGARPDGYFNQHTLILNPWRKMWIKDRFFDAEPSDDVLAITTTYRCNEYLSESDLNLFERMKRENPRRFAVAGNAEWGVEEGLVYDNWDIREFKIKEKLEGDDCHYAFGLDFGYSLDATAFVGSVIDKTNREIWVFCEHVEKKMNNRMIYDKISFFGFERETIVADCQQKKDIDDLYERGLRGIKPCRKGRDSVVSGIKAITDYAIHIHPRCENFIREITNYCWEKNSKGEFTGRPVGKEDHCLIGDTIVHTVDGDVEIKNLVGKTGEVYCYDEKSNRVTTSKFFDCRLTQKNVDVFEIEVEDGRFIRATEEHPVLTQRGWVTVKNLTEDDCIVCVKE